MLLASLLDLVLPRSCAGCAVPGPALCQACAALLRLPPVGPVRPTPCPPGLPVVMAHAAYDGPVKALLLGHKEHGRLSLTRPLGRALAGAVALHGGTTYALCPVPSDPRAVRQRGHDHALRLARAAAAELGGPAAVPLLRPARRVHDQAGLTSGQRSRNLQGALRAVGAPTEVVLVDDVLTTGATLVEAARALTAAGHVVRGAAVLAATPRRSPSPARANPW